MKLCQRTGKRSYSSARMAKRETRGVHNRIRTYFCKACGGWHVTNQDVHRRRVA